MVARDGIEPPTPAFSGLVVSVAKPAEYIILDSPCPLVLTQNIGTLMERADAWKFGLTNSAGK